MTLPFSHIYVQVATPAADNRFGGDYITSLINTKTTLEHFGAQFHWAVFPNCSDLCHARNKILGEFVRAEKYTHLLKIDSDMGWSPDDVIRMLGFDKDFISGVGCKKKLPLEWCASNKSDKGEDMEPVHMFHEGETLLAAVNYVGAGFVLISRNCAVKLLDAYQNLEYTDCYDQKRECGLYDPVYIDKDGGYKERYFDDFAFCYRWRQIGGKVYVVPDIHLKHQGNYTFEGKWEDSFKYGEKGQKD